MKKLIFVFIAAAFMTACGLSGKKVDNSTVEVAEITTPYYNAFSHNDYAHRHPLTEALNLGFNCVEADCYLVNGRWVVAHDLPEDSADYRYLEDCYLQPLFDRIKKNGGKVYKEAAQPFMLMIDIKRQGDEFYTSLRPMLEENSEMFCSVDSAGNFTEGPILLFFSGARPLDTLPCQSTTCYAFLDGQFSELGQGIPASLMPVVSDDYTQFLSWDGEGEMPQEQLEVMRELIRSAHNEGKKIRFWGAPDTEAWTRLQLSEGVDIIGVDNLPALATILSE